MTAMRQVGVGSHGGAESSAIFHQLILERATGSLNAPLARITVDEKNCLGMIEWRKVGNYASNFLRTRSSYRVETSRSFLVRSKMESHQSQRDRSAEQGDVDGPLDCSLALGAAASETRLHIAE